MLTPEYLANVDKQVISLYEDVEDIILKDIAKRIANADMITDYAEAQIKVLIENTNANEDIWKKINPYLDEIDTNLKNTIDKSAIKHYVNEKNAYEMANKPMIDYLKNERALKITNEVKDSLIQNNRILTESMGFAYDGKTYLLDNYYRQQLNRHTLMVSSGAFSFDDSAIMLVNKLADSGIKAIDYMNSGRSYSLEAASRMIIRGGINDLTNRISLMNAEELGQDLMEISAHGGARPSHAVWQGKIVSLSGTNSKYLTLDDIGYGEVTGFKGANCRHDWYPFFEGISERLYTKEYLDDLDNPDFEYDGEIYTHYQATQKARQMERSIRKYKKRAIMYKELGDDELVTTNKIKIKNHYDRYDDFIKASKLKARYSATYVYGE